MTNTLKVVRELKENNQDFEWYPTTDAMIEAIKKYAEKNGYDKLNMYSVLDCGGGDGRVVSQLGREKFIIEKSKHLINLCDKNICVVGTDFHCTTLIDKEVSTVFSNPPYKEYEQWASKILLEANCENIFLIIPQRWKTSPMILAALEKRNIKNWKIIASTDFLDAERQARAKVDIIHFDLKQRSYNPYKNVQDPFDLWFEEAFKFKKKTTTTNEIDTTDLLNSLIANYNK